ncbi:MAG: hypothetical protein HY063_03280 [Bacteroidetes bacterium]|nr:hypothetical protein [Bacteroidota bacterium]
MKIRNYIRKIIFLFFVCAPFFGCRHTRYLTEQYIKTNVEEHNGNEFSRLETYSIFQKHLHNQSGSFKGFAYLELTGYKHKGKTGMVIGAEKYHLNGKKLFKILTLSSSLETNITYVNLDLNQCKALLSNYKDLRQKIKAEKPKPFVAIYQDFNASKDFYISYRASYNPLFNKPKTKHIDFWIKGEKYHLRTRIFMKKFMNFMKYYASE